jgi:hypothetical protein
MVKRIACVLLLTGISAAGAQRGPVPDLTDQRIHESILVREDLFAGFLDNDAARLARAEQNLQQLLTLRPDDRPDLLAWQGEAAFYYAVRAYERGEQETFRAEYRRARQLFAEAKRLVTDRGVMAITGAAYTLFADRLPPNEQSAAWKAGYACYRWLYDHQRDRLSTLPVHDQGEVLSGLALAAHRTGRSDEVSATLNLIVTRLANTPYAASAQAWLDRPNDRRTVKIACQTCHEPDRLAATIARLQHQ